MLSVKIALRYRPGKGLCLAGDESQTQVDDLSQSGPQLGRQREMITLSGTTEPTDSPLPNLVDVGQQRQRGKLRRRLLTGIALVVVLGIGIAIGAAIGNNTSALNAANSQASALRSQVASLKGQVSSLNGQVSSLDDSVASWKTQAQNATATANAKASAAYASRNTALSQQETTLKQQEKTVAAEAGRLQASQISGDGVYVVGKDIKPGMYPTSGSGDTGRTTATSRL
jgi:peptidoglycan hydrolase CwlO-like protein